MQDKVQITDADMAMAAEYSRRFPDLRLPEAFARHREQATASLQARIEELEAALREANESVIAFGGPWAVSYASDFGLPEDHLHPAHYDILARAGARMDDFTRAALSSALGEG